MARLTSLLQKTSLEKWIDHGVPATVSHYLIVFVLAVLLLSLIYLTALVITAFFSMPVMVNHIAQKYYPGLERKKGGNVADSVVNAVVATAVFCAGSVLSLPFWLFPPLAIALPVILMAYLNQRMFRYDALAEHASKQEIEKVIERSGRRLYLLGVIAGLLQFVPVVNLFAPVYVGLAFIHLCLAELKQVRAAA